VLAAALSAGHLALASRRLERRRPEGAARLRKPASVGDAGQLAEHQRDDGFGQIQQGALFIGRHDDAQRGCQRVAKWRNVAKSGVSEISSGGSRAAAAGHQQRSRRMHHIISIISLIGISIIGGPSPDLQAINLQIRRGLLITATTGRSLDVMVLGVGLAWG
jgi:hypothetical protein